MISLNPFKRIKTSNPVIERKSNIVDLVPGSFLDHVFGGGSYVSARQAASFYQSTSAVATAVDMIADAVEQIEPVIQTSDGKFIKDHPVLDLVRNPNGFSRWHQFIGALARNYLLKHDSLISASGNIKRPPIEIWPVNLQTVSIIEHLDRYPSSYIITNGPITGNFDRSSRNRKIGTRFYEGMLKELYHIQGYSSRITQTESDSPLQAAANEAKQIIKGKYHNLQLLNNGGRLSLMIAFKDDDVIDDEEHKTRVKRINEQYSGPENAGKIGVISNADIAEMKEFGVNNKDMDFAELESLASFAIYLRYKVPLALISTKASTFNNLATGVELFYDQAVLPAADVLFSGLTFFLMHRFGLDPNKEKLTYNPESIDSLKTRTLNEVEKRKKINVETTNELRSLLPGREPLKDGGDDVYHPKNLIVLGADAFTGDNNNT
jgi:HK97 family phage portal protein